jgi:hypothetical protein
MWFRGWILHREKKLEKMILDFITSSKAKMVVLLDRLWTPKASHQQARGY